MRLKVVGAKIILGSFIFGAIAVRISREGTWFGRYWPLIMFSVLVAGAIIGVVGMISAETQRSDSDSNRSRQ
jgi:hypothetical protein